ncbi:MAG: tetratricopeptide repeat protein [Planctomycetes bacterium]|nr:tetratricopeptide repeat protein [Planctomycetota bacterium]MCC7170441.1 tetratricopeptide repeat protein [Planctomycetota bacterium]
MDVAKHLEKAAEAVRKKNFDYAVELYHQVLQLKPDHGEARRELRQVLVKRAEAKKLNPTLGAASGLFSRMSMMTSGIGGKPDQVALSAEKYLVNDPRNRKVNLQLAEALEKANYLNSAVAVFEFLGDDEELGDYALKKAGGLYYQLKKMEQALACYEAVLKRSPRDSEAEKARKNLAAEGVLSSGSYDPTRSSRDLARDKGKAQQLELEQRIVTTDDQRKLRQTALERELAATPTDKRARRELIDLFVRARQFDAAVATLEDHLRHEPELTEFKDRLGEVRLMGIEQQLRDAKSRAAAGDVGAATDVVDLEREFKELELAEVERRVREHPTDLGLRYRIGQLVLEAGRVDDAIEHFQYAVKDPRRRVDALIGLGAAFQAKGLVDLARKQFETALEGIEGETERSTEITYRLAVLLERTGDITAALARFESIYEKNIHFRDVGERVARLRAAKPAAASAPSTPPSPAPAAMRPAPPAAPPTPAAPATQSPQPPANDAGGDPIYGFKD